MVQLSNRLYVPREQVRKDQLNAFRYIVGKQDDLIEVENFRLFSDAYGFCRGDLRKLDRLFDLSQMEDQRARVPWDRKYNLKFEGWLEPEQKPVVQARCDNPYGLIECPPRFGKGSPRGTPVLTPSGWRAIEALCVGDQVIGSSGNAVNVTGVYPRGLLPVNRVSFMDGASVVVDDDHLWSARGSSDDAYETISTDKLRHLVAGMPMDWRVPVVAPVEFTPHDLDDPYEMGQGAAAVGLPLPAHFLFSSNNARLELLRGILDRGGLCCRGFVLFASASERLTHQVAHLARSLGGLATRPVRPIAGAYHSIIQMPPSVMPVRALSSEYLAPTKEPQRIVKSIVREPFAADVFCISVDAHDNLYVTEDFIVTHNTVCETAFLVKARQRALVLVNRTELADQWYETFEEFTNLKKLEKQFREKLVGISTKNRRDFPLVTIATYQQFIRETGFFWLRQNRDEFGLVLVDEAHVARAQEFSKVVNTTNSLYRIGTTATPYDSRYNTHVIVHDIIGPVVARGKTTPYPTDYCIHNTNQIIEFSTQADWGDYVTLLTRHKGRNNFIAEWVAQDVTEDKFVLVTTDRVKHCFELQKRIAKKLRGAEIEIVTSKTSKSKRKEIRLRARAGKVHVVIAMNSIVQLGYNVPRWSVLHNTCPLTSPENWYQRFCRVRTKYMADEVRKFGAYEKPRAMLRIYKDECASGMQYAYLRMVERECEKHGIRRVRQQMGHEPQALRGFI